MEGAGVAIVIIFIVVILILANCIKIVPQAQAYVVERLGAYQGTWSVGMHFKVPFIDTVAKKVLLKEQVVDFQPQSVITKDNVTMRIDMVVFFSDPLTAQPHDPDVKALMRIAQVYDIPMAISHASADFMITSSYMTKEYDHDVINFKKNIENRAETL